MVIYIVILLMSTDLIDVNENGELHYNCLSIYFQQKDAPPHCRKLNRYRYLIKIIISLEDGFADEELSSGHQGYLNLTLINFFLEVS